MIPAGLPFIYEGNGRNVCNRIRLVELLTHLGLPPGTTFKDKHIPDRMLLCSKKIIVAMLQGMFDGDGHSSEHNGEVGYSSGSKRLIEQLRILMLNFGIYTKTTIVERGEVVGPKGYTHIASTAYQLKASTIDSKTFYEQIGFRISYKQDKKRHLSEKPFYYMDEISSTRMINHLRTVSKKALAAIGIEIHLVLKKKRITNNTFAKLIDNLDIEDQFLHERRNEIGTVRWFPVSDITAGMSETYDIRVRDVHNFTANGIITHNCQLERTLYKYRSRPHCRNCFNPDRPSDSLLYDPPPKQYGIITIDDVVEKIDKCPTCNIKLLPYPYVLPKQGLYGGTETIIFRGMSKVFNMWSQIARTVILAYIKKEGRDRKNGHNYMSHLGARNKSQSNVLERFILEARQVSKYNEDFLKIIETLEALIKEDDKPHDGLIGKLVDRSGLSRAIVTNWFKYIKYQSFDFTDSPVNRTRGEYKNDRKKIINDEEDFG